MFNNLPKFEKLSSVVGYESAVYRVDEQLWSAPDGEQFHRQVVSNRGAVAILAINEEGSISLITQFRPALERYIFEIPAGLLDKEGEDELSAAKRELREEVGLSARNWTPLTTITPAPGMTNEVITIFAASGLSVGEPDFDGSEERYIVHNFVPIAKALAMIESGEICDGKSICAILWFERFGVKHKDN